MLAIQLGTEETSYERPFMLNLLSNEDEENVSKTNEEVDADGNSVRRNKTGDEEPEVNKDYKTKLDNAYADLFEDEREGLRRSMDLLDLLDEIE